MNREIMKRDLFARIKTTYQSLSHSEEKVGKYILGNAREVMSMTLAELAAHSKVSDTTALRFSRSLGYRGWLELKVALIRSLPDESNENISSESQDVGVRSLFTGIIEKSKLALEETLLAFDEKVFLAVIKSVIEAERILIAGSGTSGPIAQDLYNRLFRLGLFCRVETDGLLQIMQTSLMTPKDLLIVISQSGEAESILRTADTAKKAGVPIITITGSRLSGLAKLSKHILLSVCHEPNVETMSARIAQHAIVQALSLALSGEIGDIARINEDKIWDAFFPNSPDR
jgi:DNA-binding MurR/RpiR family transcriptional regulator